MLVGLDSFEDRPCAMPNKQQRNKPTPGDLIGNKAMHFRVSLNDGRAECLCHVYALVLKDIGSTLGATQENNNKLTINEPKNREAIQHIITALERIHLELSKLSMNSALRESCPEYSTLLYSDINDLIPKLNSIIPPLKNMAKIYGLAKQDPEDHAEQFNAILDASERYEGYLLECRTCIIGINIRVIWWCEKLSPQGCQGRKAAG